MTLDPRGRLWVVENSSYPIWLGGPHGGDRILIFEDDDGDGRFDRRTVFYDKGTNFTGIELGYGGVWVCATPNLLFFPDRDGDDRPDGPPVVKLDGWNVNAQHNLFNALKWGPDGWLWGCHGILSTANVGKPGTPKDQRVPMNCGVWRYHPTREVFEVVAHGTTNPWGLDFDDFGKAFITNCVIAHLFRVIPGSHFERMYGSDFNPHLYELMAACRRPPALGRRALAGRARGQSPARHPGRRTRPRRRDDLPGRQLAREIPQLDVHREYPRPSREQRPARSDRRRL